MPRFVQFGGVIHEFPDEATDEMIADALRPSSNDLGAQAKEFAARVRASGRKEPDAATQAGMAAGLFTGGLSLPAQAAVHGGSAFLASRLAGNDRKTAASEGAIQAVLPGVTRAALRGAGWAADKAREGGTKLVLSYVKPRYAELQRRAGIEGSTPTAVARNIARFMVDKRLTTSRAAQDLVKASGQQVDEAIRAAESPEAASTPVLDTPERIPRYLNALLRKVEQQILPGRDRTAIQNTARELVNDSPLSTSTARAVAPETLEEGLARGTREAMTAARNRGQAAVTERRVEGLRRVQNDRPRTEILRSVDEPSEMDALLRRAAGEQPARPQVVLRGPQTGRSASYASSRPRDLRANVRPSEGMTMVRTKSYFAPDASGGEIAAGRTIERAVRDSVKAAVPAARAPLRVQGRALDASRLLERGEHLAQNRDTLGGFAQTMGLAGNMRGVIAQMLKESQLRLGAGAIPRLAAVLEGAGTMDPRVLNALLADAIGRTHE